MWEIEYTDEFGRWYDTLSVSEQDAIRDSVSVLQTAGPNLGRPYVDSIAGSRHANMKELRTQSRGNPLRTFFAFDSGRCAILLIGGDKTGDKRFYDKMIPLADRLYDEHLAELKNEGEI